MKRIFTLFIVFIIFIAIDIPAFADAGDEVLMGHHWAIPKYINEIHFQMIVMIIVLIALGTYKQIKRIKNTK